MLYELLSGRRAFEGEDVPDTLAAVLLKSPDWSALPAETPVSIRTLLRRCLEKDRRKRLADAADVRLEIEDALSPDPSTPAETDGMRHRIDAAVAAAREETRVSTEARTEVASARQRWSAIRTTACGRRRDGPRGSRGVAHVVASERRRPAVVSHVADASRTRHPAGIHRAGPLWLAHQSNESGRNEVYVRPFTGGPAGPTKWQITTTGGNEPGWSRDGTELYYVASDGKLMATTVIEGDAFRTTRPTMLFDPGQRTSLAWDVGPDGRFVMTVAASSAAATISVVQNWPVLLKQR